MNTEKIVKRVKERLAHSEVFKKILALKARDKIQEAIKSMTHEKPLLVFWIDPNASIIDAGQAHRDTPPNKDKTIFSDPTHKGHLRGMAAEIGDKIYIVIYLNSGEDTLTKKQLYLLRRAYPALLQKIQQKNKKLDTDKVNSAIFISEIGDVLQI